MWKPFCSIRRKRLALNRKRKPENLPRMRNTPPKKRRRFRRTTKPTRMRTGISNVPFRILLTVRFDKRVHYHLAMSRKKEGYAASRYISTTSDFFSFTKFPSVLESFAVAFSAISPILSRGMETSAKVVKSPIFRKNASSSAIQASAASSEEMVSDTPQTLRAYSAKRSTSFR